jgi:hypothetical protein
MAINVPIVSEFAPDGVKKAMKEFERLEKTSEKVSFAMEKAFLPATAAVAGLATAAGLATKAAAEDASQQAELERQIRVSTDATNEQIDALHAFIDAQELASAVSDNELRPALQILARHTGDLAEAQELLTLALDISAGTGRDVFDVAERLAEGYTGVLTPLEELDYGLVAAIESGATFDEVAASLAQTFEGAVAANAETVAGRFQRMQVSIDQAQESIGMALLPILEKLLPILEDVATFVAENTELFIAIGAAIATVAGIVIAYNTALKLYAVAQGIATAATAVFNAVLAANPIVLIVLAIAGLVATLIVLEKKFGVVTKVIEAVKIAFDAVSDAVSWLAGKFVDFINTLIDVANKIPFVSIDKLTNVFEEQAQIVEDKVTPAIEGYADAELEVAEAIAEAAYQQQLANLDYEEAERLMDELHPTLDDVEAAIGRTNDAMARHHEAQQFISDMNTDLIDEFNYLFGIFDNDEAVDNFSDAILDAAEAVKEYGEGSREAEEASRDVYRELGKVIDQLDNIPATKQLELIALLDQGEYDAVLAQLEVLNAIANTALTTLTAAEIAAAAGMVGGGDFAPAPPLPTPVSSVQIGPSNRSGVRSGDMNVTVNMPAGTDPNELVRVLERAGRQSGSLPIPTTGQIRS